jgi:hypothetical protein
MLAAPPTDKDPILEDVPLKLTFAVVKFAVPPVITTAFAFWMDIVPRPVTLAFEIDPLVMVTLPNVRLLIVVVVLLAATLVLPRVIGKPEDPPPALLTVFNMITSHHLELYICLPYL